MINNDTILTVRADMQPFLNEHRCGYCITVQLERDDIVEYEQINDFTDDKKTAEKFFDMLTICNIFPCHLKRAAEDFSTIFSKE